MKVTKQGVRDLSGLPGKSKGKKVEEVPAHLEAFCAHDQKHHLPGGDTQCSSCGALWDWDGRQY